MEHRFEQYKSLYQRRFRDLLPQLFGSVDPKVADELLSFFTWVALRGGDPLFALNDPGDSMYMVITGRLQAIGENGAILGDISPGEAVGEMALISGESRMASVIAVRDSMLLRLDREGFRRVVAHTPDFATKIAQQIIHRLRKPLSVRKAAKINTLTILPISPGEKVRAYGIQIAEQLGKKRRSWFLHREIFDALTFPGAGLVSSKETEQYLKLTFWLEEQELEQDLVIYLADYEPTPWTERCLRSADEILLLGEAGQNPAPSPSEKQLLYGITRISGANQRMVLIHPPEAVLPKGTATWLDQRSVQFHYHVRYDKPEDTARLCRYLEGRAVGLTLSGGGARGLAHVGVHKALREAGIPIDIVGGASAGALVAGFIAYLEKPEAVQKEAFYAAEQDPTAKDWAWLPLVSFKNGARMERVLASLYGGKMLEDLWLPFFCVSSNLSTSEPVIHRRGDMLKSVRASVSIPGLFPPEVFENSLLIDGGVFNNLPVDVMNDMGVGKIIAINLNQDEPRELNYLKVPSAWTLLKDKLLSKKSHYRVPDLGSIIGKSMVLNSNFKSAQIQHEVDLFFNPDLSRFSILDWKAYREMDQIGYEHALEVLADRDWSDWQ